MGVHGRPGELTGMLTVRITMRIKNVYFVPVRGSNFNHLLLVPEARCTAGYCVTDFRYEDRLFASSFMLVSKI